jgi:hypothetical protein
MSSVLHPPPCEAAQTGVGWLDCVHGRPLGEFPLEVGVDGDGGLEQQLGILLVSRE